MPVTRYFLGWDAPLVPKVCEVILRDAKAKPVDLSGLLIVVPTRQAGRRLREALAVRCAARGTGMLSPRVEVPAFFLHPEEQAENEANDVQVAAAWCDVLLAADLKKLPGLFPVAPPARDFAWALRTGSMIQSLRTALTDGGCALSEVIQKHGSTMPELERWLDLRKLEKLYLNTIAKGGLRDPCDAQLAWAEKPALPPGVKRVVLAGVPDPAPLALRALEKMTDDVDVLIHAPEKMQDMFDAWGRPLADAWKNERIEIPDPDRNILLAASAMGQAQAVLEEIGDADLAELAIGVPDPDVVPELAAEFARHGLKAFDPAGRPLESHAVFQLVDAARGLINDGRFEDLAHFLRHADVLNFLEKSRDTPARDLLIELDEYQNEFLPTRADDVNPSSGALAVAMTWVRDVRKAKNIRRLLQIVYEFRTVNPNDPAGEEFVAVAKEVNDALEQVAKIEDLDPSDAMELLLLSLIGRAYYPDREDADVDLDGWLELAWHDAPTLIVTGMNDGVVPDCRVNDPFLTDSLRARLGLRDDAGRLARDAFLLRALAESRRAAGRVCFIAGRTNSAGDPLRPSRLLFRCDDKELMTRAKRLFRPMEERRENLPASVSFTLNVAPPPGVDTNLDKIGVTTFRGYLACPFRFYLGNILGMESVDARKAELDAMDFGGLVHYAVQRMGENPDWSMCADVNDLALFLADKIESWAEMRFGPHPSLPVRVQLESARQRLAAAARVHVASVQEGWEIVEVEKKISMLLAGVEVRGRIDRVEVHRARKIVRVLDYKTTDTAYDPAGAHLENVRGGERPYAVHGEHHWVDLQLPLYRLMLDGFEGYRVEAGYFNLPKAVSGTAISIWADFDDVLLASAKRCAEGVIADLQARRFWPPAERVEYDEFESLFPAKISDCVDVKAFERSLKS